MITLIAVSHMKIIGMLLVYLLNGEIVVEQKSFEDKAACQIETAKRVQEIQKDPRFQGGFGAWCFDKPGQAS